VTVRHPSPPIGNARVRNDDSVVLRSATATCRSAHGRRGCGIRVRPLAASWCRRAPGAQGITAAGRPPLRRRIPLAPRVALISVGAGNMFAPRPGRSHASRPATFTPFRTDRQAPSSSWSPTAAWCACAGWPGRAGGVLRCQAASICSVVAACTDCEFVFRGRPRRPQNAARTGRSRRRADSGSMLSLRRGSPPKEQVAELPPRVPGFRHRPRSSRTSSSILSTTPAVSGQPN
jgi:hypothetical protein